MGTIVCSVKDACELLKHMEDEDIVVLNILNTETFVHEFPQKIKKKKGEELIKKADDIYYQNNDFFGTLFLYGVLKEKNIIHNIQFPKLE